MKKYTLLSIAMLAFCGLFAQSFEGRKFGYPLSKFPGMELRSESGNVKTYTFPNDTILRYSFVSEVVYAFNNDTLFLVMVNTKEGANKAVYEYIKDRYDGITKQTPNEIMVEIETLRVNFKHYPNQPPKLLVYKEPLFRKVFNHPHKLINY